METSVRSTILRRAQAQARGEPLADDATLHLVARQVPRVVKALEPIVSAMPSTKSLPLRLLRPEEVAFEAIASCVAQSAAHISRDHPWTLWGIATNFVRRLAAHLRGLPETPEREAALRVLQVPWRKAKGETPVESDEPFDDSAKLQLTAKVVDAVIAGTQWFTVESHPTIHLVPTEKFVREVEEATRRQLWEAPAAPVMLCPPRPWEKTADGYEGGYLTPRLSLVYPLIRGGRRAHKDALGSLPEPPRAVAAVNAIQGVPLRLDTATIEVAQRLFAAGIPISGIADPCDSLARSYGGSEIAEARRQAGATIYLPHALDFRGRVYPTPGLNHHRADWLRGSFLFAEPRPIGHDGLTWLSLHVANTGDFDKVSKKPLVDRLVWVEMNRENIRAAVREPLGRTYEWWSSADKPFSFLTSCRSLVSIWDGGGTTSSVPVALDGTCSGLQHYACLTRNRADAAVVNLVPSDRPSDIYSLAADRVLQSVLEAPESPERTAWLSFGITRKVVKRNVMTFPYSAVRFGFADQIMEDTVRPVVKAGGDHPFAPLEKVDKRTGEVRETHFPYAQYLAAHSWAAVTSLVTGAAVAMEWLRHVAAVCYRAGMDVQWETPMGFPVVNRYLAYDEKRVQFRLGGAPREVLVRVPSSGRLARAKQENAMAPNFVHSMDAAHLQAVALRLKDAQIPGLFIHDSFGAAPGDAGHLAHCVRSEMVALYRDHDPLADLCDRTQRRLPGCGQGLAPPPGRGAWDLSEILRAPYAFS